MLASLVWLELLEERYFFVLNDCVCCLLVFTFLVAASAQILFITAVIFYQHASPFLRDVSGLAIFVLPFLHCLKVLGVIFNKYSCEMLFCYFSII